MECFGTDLDGVRYAIVKAAFTIWAKWAGAGGLVKISFAIAADGVLWNRFGRGSLCDSESGFHYLGELGWSGRVSEN